MLALTHHFIVMYCAHKVGLTRFDEYAILGDDIVIAHEAVAEVYLQVMTELGVEINSHKSLQSNIGVFEYAKRLVGPEGEYTGAGPKGILNAVRKNGYKHIPSLVVDIAGKGRVITDVMIQDLLASIPKLFGLRRKTEVLLHNTLVSPLGVF